MSETNHPAHWPKGTSGNPAGRPRGARNKATLAAEALLEGEAERLTRAAVDAALEGDVLALRLCLDRIIPAGRSRRIVLDLPEAEGALEIKAALQATLRAMAEGAISPDEAMTITAILEAQRRTVETVDLEQRIAILEAAARADERLEPATRYLGDQPLLPAPAERP